MSNNPKPDPQSNLLPQDVILWGVLSLVVAFMWGAVAANWSDWTPKYGPDQLYPEELQT